MKIKQLIISAMILGFAAVPFSQPKAVVGLATLNPGMMWVGMNVGGYSMGAGLLVAFAGYEVCGNEINLRRCPAHGLGILASYAGMLYGAVLLDESGSEFTFEQLTDSERSDLDITKRQLEVYNSEVEECSFVMSQALSEVRQLEDKSVANAQEILNSYKEYLSDETFEVVEKIFSKSFQK